MTRPLPIANENNAPADKIISQDSKRTTFYVVRFNGPITQDRRKELVKRCNAEGEHAKVAIRNIRRDGIEHIKKLQKDGLSEDICKDAEANAQATTDKYISLVEKHLTAKDKEIMAI